MSKTISAFLKKIIASLLIVNVLIIFLLNSVSIAAPEENIGDKPFSTVEEAREHLASFASKFSNEKGMKCIYNYLYNEVYPNYLNGFSSTEKSTWNTYINGKEQDWYYFECTGFVACMIYWGLGLYYPSVEWGYLPVDVGGVNDTTHFQEIEVVDQNSAQVGDILICSRTCWNISRF